MQEKLEKATEEFKKYSERFASLFKETFQCLEEMKVHTKLTTEAINAMSSSLNTWAHGQVFARGCFEPFAQKNSLKLSKYLLN